MDVINQGLLLIGIRRSLRLPNNGHPYGFHREQYAWAMISAMGILFVGGGVPIYHGVSAILEPHTMFLESEHLAAAYTVLCAALVCEGCKLVYYAFYK
jgi:zinc transporter 9